MRPADELERRRLSDTFTALRALPEAPGLREAVALRVRNELIDLGFTVDGDPLAPVPVSLLCRLPGPVAELPVAQDGEPAPAVAPSVLLGARLDRDAALLLAVAHRARIEPLPCAVELLFTTGGEEQTGLPGDPDAARLASAYGFFFDHAGPLGEVVTCTPTTYRLEVDFHRRPDAYREPVAAAVGPDEAARAAMPAPAVAARAVVARAATDLPGDTRVSVEEAPGRDEGGARLVATVRSSDEGDAEQTVSALVDRSYDAGNEPASACDVDVVVTRLAGGLRHGAGQPAVRVAEAALRRCGREPRRVIGDRATEADRLTASGVWCVSLARGGGAGLGGAPAVLAPDDLDAVLDLALTLLDEAAA